MRRVGRERLAAVPRSVFGPGFLRAPFLLYGLAAGSVLAVSVVACGGNTEGMRDEGPGRDPGPVHSGREVAASGSHPVDAPALIRKDPEVPDAIKQGLSPCVKGRKSTYPLDVSYGRLTGGSAEDVLVNVLTCGDNIGLASYVYRWKDGGWDRVFHAEQAPVYAEINGRRLVVTRQFYGEDDAVAYPSGEDVLDYRWKSTRFTLHHRTHNDYGRLHDDGPAPTPAPSTGAE